MSSLLRTASWVIVEKATNKALFETFNEAIVGKINESKYQAVPILAYLQQFNQQVRGQSWAS